MIYSGLTAALATQHGKENAIAPPLAALTGLRITVPPGIDTDRLGTFTGEVPRPASPRDTLRMKARLGMEAAGLPLGIASEGSFGPHPFMPFLATGRETMMLIDDTRGIEIIEEAVSENTNFAAVDVSAGADVTGFLSRVGFPDHAVVLRDGGRIIKGITSPDELSGLIRLSSAKARLETDMRAHVNPTRMAEIGKLAARFAQRIATPCPACGAPGYGTLRSEMGLPCSDCGAPTALVQVLVSGCPLCRHEHRTPRPDGRITATPAECPECNP